VGQQPALGALYNGALQQFSSGGPTYYPNSTVAPLSPVTQKAQSMLYSRAVNGSPINSVARGQAMRTLGDGYLNAAPGQDWLSHIGSGGMLNSNPYVNQTFQNAADSVNRNFRTTIMPGVASMYSGAGRFGSNAMNTAMGTAEQNLGDTYRKLATDIYGQNYGQERVLQQQALGELGNRFSKERTLQMGALGSAPGIANQDYFDIGQLGQLGQQQDTFNQGLLNADMNRYNYYQQLPEHNLQVLNNLVTGGNSFGTTSSSGQTKTPSQPLAGAAGGALLGSSLTSALGVAGPWGALGGAVLGGLLS
jgi:hypothetical protein